MGREFGMEPVIEASGSLIVVVCKNVDDEPLTTVTTGITDTWVKPTSYGNDSSVVDTAPNTQGAHDVEAAGTQVSSQLS